MTNRPPRGISLFADSLDTEGGYERPIFGRRKHGDFEDESLMLFEEQDPDKLYPT
jgi:hypothetical protein